MAHGATGKGNDQVRFELNAYALDPEIKVIAPWREWEFASRTALLAFAEANQIPIAKDKRNEAPFSTDANLLHISSEGKVLEDPAEETPPYVYSRTVDPESAPDKPTVIEVAFEKGDAHGNMLYPTMMFRLNGVDPDKAAISSRAIGSLMEEAEKRGVTFPRKGAIIRPQKHNSEWRVNVTQVKNADGDAVDATDAVELSQGEIEGRKQAMAFFDFLRREAPGFENAYVVDIPPQLGVRETRRVKGLYELTADDVLTCASFDDTIGVNGWPMESHVAGDVVFTFPPIPESRGFNELPYRMITPEGLDNLLVAGRCASMTHDGQSAARVSGACLAMGEAAGTAAALALGGNTPPRDIAVDKLQLQLKRQGAFIGRDQGVPEGL